MKQNLQRLKGGRTVSPLYQKMLMLLLLLVVGVSGAWAQTLTAKLGKQVAYSDGEYSHWIQRTSDLFDGYSDKAIVAFEYYVENFQEGSEDAGRGSVESLEDATTNTKTKILDIKYTKNGWNRHTVTLGDLRTKMASTTSTDGKQGFISNAWYKEKGGCTKSRIVVYEEGLPASGGSWECSNNTYTWVSSTGNLMPIFTFTSGELANYSELDLTTSGYTGTYRVAFLNGGTAVAKIVFYSAGEKKLVFSEREETKDIDLSQITSIQFGGEESSGSIVLDPNSIKLRSGFTITWDASKIPSGALNAWYTLGDDATHITETRTNVPQGTKVKYHADGGTSVNYDINGWREGEGDGDWLGWGQSYEVPSLDKDILIWPEFQPVHYYDVSASDGGNAYVYQNNDLTVDINGQKRKSWEDKAYYYAVPDDDYLFIQWNDGNTDNPRTVTGNETGRHYSYTAEFEPKSGVRYVDKFVCNHTGDKTGNNKINLAKLNAHDGATISISNGVATINKGSGNGYVSINFKEVDNLKDLKSWYIKEGENISANINSVLFYEAEGASNVIPGCDFYNSAANRDYGIDGSKLTKVQEIRLYFEGNETTLNISEICFKIEHEGRTTPTLDGSTTPDIAIVEGESVHIGNTPGYWRQYTDNSYSTIKEDGKIPTNEWVRAYDFDDLTIGDYYFAACDGGNCGLGYRHESELVKVHVRVRGESDFITWYKYANRLAAQWNFDQCDSYRFNRFNINANGYTGWTVPASIPTTGTVTYTLNQSIGNLSGSDTDASTYSELSYDGNPDHKLPVTAGLLFKAPANSIKIEVVYENGQPKGTHLIVSSDVKMIVPYVENSYRNDMLNDKQPVYGFNPDDPHDTEYYDWNNQYKGNWEEGSSLYDEYKNCMHHIKRDILYLALKNNANAWDYIVNDCIDKPGQQQYDSGGDEHFYGAQYYKFNYKGTNHVPCVIRFKKETTFTRIGVNRNLTYSFYSEYIGEELGLSDETPFPRLRVIGSPTGYKVANMSITEAKYDNAIAFTYGGWKNYEGSNSYKSYNNNDVTDAWTKIGVYCGDNNFYTWDNMENASSIKYDVPIASDGFPVLSVNTEKATSGSLMPTGTPDSEMLTVNKREVPNYHPLNDGKFYVGTDKPYKANITPWSLPSRGAYLKFEPSLPGVLNVHMLQYDGATYFIADEFGKPISSHVFRKSASGMNEINAVDAAGNKVSSNGVGFKLTGATDYVKYSFNAIPGKTYYIFSNEKGLGFAGFYYEPFVLRPEGHENEEFTREDIGVYELTLSGNSNYTYPSAQLATKHEIISSPKLDGSTEDYSIHYSNEAVKITLDRQFKANEWNSICLPYSMNQVQMEQQFGVGTRVVLLRDIQDKSHTDTGKTTLTLICHENQDIIAGYPYFILPTKDVNSVTTYAYLPSEVPSIVTIDGVGPNTNSYQDMTYNGISGYTFKGTYSSANVKNGSYYVGNGVLKRLNTSSGSATLNPYRAWIDYNGTSSAKRVGLVDGMDADLDEEETTDIDIDAVLEEQGIFTRKATVYSVNGTVVRKNAENLDNLPKGIYIVNGKKYIVK